MALKDFWRRFSASSRMPSEIAIISALEDEVKSLSDAQFKEESPRLKERLKSGETLDEVLPRAFALVREASRRTLGQRHFDVQLWGGIVLHRGAVAEMMTGEGKTLAATAPI